MTEPNAIPDDDQPSADDLDAVASQPADDDQLFADDQLSVDDEGDDGAEAPLDAMSATETDFTRLLAEQQDKYLRLFADFENFRRRAVRDRQDAELRGMRMLISGLLDSLDDLGRVAHVDAATTPAQAIVDGVAMVEKKVLKSLAGHGLQVVSPEGEVFNPALHEALSAIPAALPEEDERVAQVYQVGYVFNGQLLRAARVVVKQWHG